MRDFASYSSRGGNRNLQLAFLSFDVLVSCYLSSSFRFTVTVIGHEYCMSARSCLAQLQVGCMLFNTHSTLR